MHSVEFTVILKNYFMGIPEYTSIQLWIKYFTGSISVKKSAKLSFTAENIDQMDLSQIVNELNSLAARANRVLLQNKIRQRTVTPTVVIESAEENKETIENVEEEKSSAAPPAPLRITARDEFVFSLRGRSKREKLFLLQQFASHDPDIQNLANLTTKSNAYLPKDKRLYHQEFQLVLNCLENHFNSDIDAMLQRHTSFALSKRKLKWNRFIIILSSFKNLNKHAPQYGFRRSLN
jgi:hypothetical protein